MTIQQLKYIIALDKERHFARAAEECLVTQPGLTIQLKNLEEEIGIRIFDRSKVPLKPTAAGEVIIQRAKKVLREIDAIRNYVISEKNDLTGNVRLGVVSTLSPYLMPTVIKRIRELAPQLKFEIREMPTGYLTLALENDEIDIALMATPTGSRHLKEFPLFNEQFLAFLNPSHSMANQAEYELQDNDKLELLLLREEYCYNAQLLDICDISSTKLKDQFDLDINTIETLKNMVRADLGFAIVPELSVQHETDSSLFKSFKDPKPVREISLVVHDTFTRPLVLEKISEAVLENLPENIKNTTSPRRIRWDDSPYFRKSVSQFL